MPDSFPYGAKTYAYDGDRLTGCSNNTGVTWTFAHDGMGRMTSDGHSGTAISYNMIDLPSKITKSDVSVVKYSYLADGRKTSSLTGDGIGLVYRGPFVYRRDASGALTFESATCAGGRLEPDAAYRYVTDHLGSTRAVARMDTYGVGDVVDYSSYGERTQVSGVSQTRLYFTGKEDQSVDFGLPYVDFGARHYSPGLHRWLVPDPLGENTPTVSAYAYCANNPINLVDPDGMRVRFAEGSSQAFKDQFAAVVKFMNSKGTSFGLARLEKSRITYYIKEVKSIGDQGFKSLDRTKMIYWCPSQVAESDLGIWMSPATMLYHEVSHATEYDRVMATGDKKERERYKANHDKIDGFAYDTYEERRVITKGEQYAARRHGEIDSDQITRAKHKARVAKFEILLGESPEKISEDIYKHNKKKKEEE